MKRIGVLLITFILLLCSIPLVKVEASDNSYKKNELSTVLSYCVLQEMTENYIRNLSENSMKKWGDATKISSSKALFEQMMK